MVSRNLNLGFPHTNPYCSHCKIYGLTGFCPCILVNTFESDGVSMMEHELHKLAFFVNTLVFCSDTTEHLQINRTMLNMFSKK